MKLSPISRRDFIKRFQALGWEGPYAGGKHQYMGKGQFNVTIPNPHRGGEIGGPFQKRILHQAGISLEEWLNVR